MHMDSERESYAQLPEFTPGVRRCVETAIASLMALLDALDGDPDIEDDDPTEPVGDSEGSLGWPAAMSQAKLGPNTEDGDSTAPEHHGKGFVRCGSDDLELVNEDGTDLDRGELDMSDMEPSIGWPEDFTAKLSDALQADHDPEQDDADLEDSDVDHDAGAEPPCQRSAHPPGGRGAHV